MIIYLLLFLIGLKMHVGALFWILWGFGSFCYFLSWATGAKNK